MIFERASSRLAACRIFSLSVMALTTLMAGSGAGRSEEEKKPSPCTEDAMIVFDASGSMSGNQTLGIPNSQARIDEVRAALAQVLPSVTKFRRVGLVTYGPGPYNECNVKVEFAPTLDAAQAIMSTVNALVPAGKTPLTSAVEQAAQVLDFKKKPSVIVVVPTARRPADGRLARLPDSSR
jgi:Ca-activated chloride channel family protein